MKVLNFGSLNIDHVYQVERIARPGETLPSAGRHGFHPPRRACRCLTKSLPIAKYEVPLPRTSPAGP